MSLSNSQNPLDLPIESLYTRGKISQSASKIKEKGYKRAKDLMWLFPSKVLKLENPHSYKSIKEGQPFHGHVEILSTRPFGGPRGGNLAIRVKELGGDISYEISWFHIISPIREKLKRHKFLRFLGTPREGRGLIQITNPEILELSNELDSNFKPQLRVYYPTVNGVPPHLVKKTVAKIKDQHFDLLVQSPKLDNQQMDLSTAFKVLHGRVDPSEFSPNIKLAAENRIIYQEFFEERLQLSLKQKITSESLKIHSHAVEKSFNLFPFQLTHDQKSTIRDVVADLNGRYAMKRMVQGDVGCGKTVVAFASALLTIQKGGQVALMAPTETLAKQHYRSFLNLDLNDIRAELIIGSNTAKEKNLIKQDLSEHKIDILIGTHALFQKEVDFNQLKLVIIDEQHKFGVGQRDLLLEKSTLPNLLLMSATPIPRSLGLTLYGDMDISLIKEMPPNRKSVKTRAVNSSLFPKFLSFIKTRLSMGEQVYACVPAIEESDMDILSVNKVVDRLSSFFSDYNVQGLHGRMATETKEQLMNQFRENKIQLLVSTSVIEVGIDVSNATVMAIFNAERFGLSTLHQLRGRVGRGGRPGFCFLIHDTDLSPEAHQRLNVIESTHDGFKVSEEDLKMRGEGEVLGSHQSGGSSRVLADLVIHEDIFKLAIDDFKKFRPDHEVFFSTPNHLLEAQ